MNKNDDDRILTLLNESFSEHASDEEHEEPYFSGLEDSDNTDDDPHYVPTDTDDSDEDCLNTTVRDTVSETIDSVITRVCTNESTDSDIVICPTPSMKGKNGHLWCNRPSQIANTRTAARNLVHIRQGPVGTAKNITKPAEIFSLFFTEEMRNTTIEHTNSAITRKQTNYANANKTVSILDKEEFDAFLGILILTASQKDNHMPTKKLFNSEFCGDRYKATMSRSRFDFIIEALRFDNKDTRLERSKTDRFAPIRNVWDLFISSCKQNYKPGSYLTIDEQLLAFRGRCSFRMYIPNKPSKYGLKIVMICDTGSKYMVDAIPYLGKGTTPRGVPQAQFLVKELTRTIYGTNRNITCDNWFTTIPLANELLAPPINLTMVGTLRRDKPEIPNEMKETGGRKIGSSMFCFDGPKTMVSYKAKKNKVVLLLSTCHEKPGINEYTKKPDIIDFYNSTKGAVDTLDQMCNQMSCSRKTKRWPLCVFYGMINIMIVNCYVVYVANMVSSGNKPLSRRDFATEIHKELVKPWLERRLQYQFLARPLRQSIAQVLQQEVPDIQPAQEQPQGRKICGFCPSKKRRMTRFFCKRCSKAMCGDHQGQWCYECVQQE